MNAARLRWLAAPMLCLLLAGACMWLYARAQGYDAAGYFESVALLRQLKQLDAHWELDAMKSRIGLNQNYDPLVDPLPDMGDLPQQLNALAAPQSGEQAGRLTAAVAAYQGALQDKAALVESFKSHNAVLRNSLSFLPTAADDIAAQALLTGGAARAGARAAADAANRVLLATLIYSQLAGAVQAQQVGDELARMEAIAGPLDQAMRERLGRFDAHVRTVLRERDQVADLLKAISAAPTAARIDDISALLGAGQQRAMQQLQSYRLSLTLLAASLAGLLLWLAVRLLRSHATINRVNGELQHANDHLERRVQERTGELVQANAQLQTQIAERKQLESRLVQSEKLASIGQLAAGIAHEINNPMAFLSSNFGMLEGYMDNLFEMLGAYEQAEPALPPAQAVVLASLRQRIDLLFLKEDIPSLMHESRGGMDRVSKIIQDLKDFSHVESEQKWERADLRVGLKSTLNIVASQLRLVADVVTEYGDMPDVECLPSQLNQVFMNLMQNAAHAIGPQRGTITLRSGGDAAQAWVEVIDTGCGIPPHVLPRIFDPFYTTKPIGKGTGLGLSLSYGIVQKHGGRIDVETAPGAGTTFRVTLPVKQSIAQAA
jgi:signal transduction histidine kinase